MFYADKCGFCEGTGESQYGDKWYGDKCFICGGVGFYAGPSQHEYLICPHCGCVNDGQDLVNDMGAMNWDAEFEDVQCEGCGKTFAASVHLEVVASFTTRKERSV